MLKASIWSQNHLVVHATMRGDGALMFTGQDLSEIFGPGTEYEYTITVAPSDVPRVRVALGAGQDDDLLALLVAAAGEIVPAGEQRWLRSLGIEPELWSHVST